jgi:hypothetical protein
VVEVEVEVAEPLGPVVLVVPVPEAPARVPAVPVPAVPVPVVPVPAVPVRAVPVPAVPVALVVTSAVPALDVLVEEVPADEVVVDEVPVDEVVVDEVPVDKLPVDEVPVDEVPVPVVPPELLVAAWSGPTSGTLVVEVEVPLVPLVALVTATGSSLTVVDGRLAVGSEVVVGTTWTGLKSTGVTGTVLGVTAVPGGPPAKALERAGSGAAGETGSVGCDPGSCRLLARTALSSATWAASRWRWTSASAFARLPFTFASVDSRAACCAVAAERSASSCSLAARTRSRWRESATREALSLASAAR